MTVDHLDGILARKREEIGALRPRAAELESRARAARPARPWASALRDPSRVRLIAEIKRKAPSAGALRPDLDPAGLARSYAEADAAALSVLTDRDFDGTLEDLERARGSVSIPVLRKDFVLDPLQIWESRAAGADAVLVIVRALDDSELGALLDVAASAGLGVLLEVHDEAELARALRTDAEVIGINNRDLTSFRTSLEVTRRLATGVPGDRILVAESGIGRPEEVRGLGELGVDAVLVGRALLSDADPGRLARELANQPRTGRRP